ncbi:hypothetical protein BCV70DRAFT_192804 [Testicularia cyperi]|uniref:Anaphase-promoting complex subunit 1 N-terminal domain-containing protein n=1 Tax=Testicularia cyperi TaxID=1882483 RepID=A0A317XM15_9BASI|nr:hypothetical protein BCV70DRAFT_192804 [Testicularia cyperi]
METTRQSSAAQRIRQQIHLQNQHQWHNQQEPLDESLLGPPSALLTRLRKIRAGSTAVSHGSYREPQCKSQKIYSDGYSDNRTAKGSQHDHDSHSAEQELCWNDRTLVWTRGSRLFRTFTFPYPVMQAFWTDFDVQPTDPVRSAPGQARSESSCRGRWAATAPLHRALCVFFEHAIHIHIAALGEQIELDLPFRFARAFPAPVGFLVQRQIEVDDERIAAARSRNNDAGAQSSSGYPFPDVSQDSGDAMLSSPARRHDATGYFAAAAADADDLGLADFPPSILPMVFYLGRSFDDLVPVDRYPQLSSASGSDGSVSHMTHGPSSPFAEIHESIVFVSDTSSSPTEPHIIVTLDHQSNSIKIYAFAADSVRFETSATLLSLSRAWPSPLKPSAALPGYTNGPADVTAASMESLTSRTMALDSNAPGKGFPPISRRSARFEMERRSSGIASAAMGRDPSGRSRRISAMHAGANDPAASARNSDDAVGGSQARDRTLGNISHTVDGLRLQSQAYTHESMIDELGPGSSSMRMPGSQGTGVAARLRRSSQAARTPYGGPRTSGRQASSSVSSRIRPSLNLSSRLDLHGERDTQSQAPLLSTVAGETAGAMASGNRLDEFEEETLAEIADLDGFARSFACVSLLEEIKLQHSISTHATSEIRAFIAAFPNVVDDGHLCFISIPTLSQTICRRIVCEHVSTAGAKRSLLYSRSPNESAATALYPSSQLALVRAVSASSTEIVELRPDGDLYLHLGPPSSQTPMVALGRWTSYIRIPADQALVRSCESDSQQHTQVASSEGSRVTLLVSGDKQGAHIDLDLDLGTACRSTDAVLHTLEACLPRAILAKIKAGWIEQRIARGRERDYTRSSSNSETGKIPTTDWDILTAVLSGRQRTHTSSSSAWQLRLATSLTHNLCGNNELLAALKPLSVVKDKPTSTTIEPAVILDGFAVHRILLSLHILAQEAVLDADRRNILLPRLVKLISSIAQARSMPAWLDASTDHMAGLLQYSQANSEIDSGASTLRPCADLYAVLNRILSGSPHSCGDYIPECSADHFGPALKALDLRRFDKTFPTLSAILSIYAVLGGSSSAPAVPSRVFAVHVVRRILELGMTLDQVRSLPSGVGLPLLEALRSCQVHPPQGQTATFYRFVQRAELVLNQCGTESRRALDLPQRISPASTKTLPQHVSLDPICAQLFDRDFRLTDVVKMLQTSEINVAHVSESENQSEAAIAELHSSAVAAVGERTRALPVGRGMLFLASRSFSPTSKWRIPPINLAVKVQPRGITIKPDLRPETATLDWPEFHNGVASILELQIPSGLRIDSKWIFAHLGEQVTSRHAGFLLGLGLMRQLPSLTPVHVFRYLKLRNNLVTIGFLLGMAASAIGTADPTARHLIGMQLVAFLPPGSAPLNLNLLTQTAGLLAMGLVFLGSSHRWTAKRMLDQIGAQEAPSPYVQPQHRDAYSLSAGLALGLVYLGKGRIDGMRSLPDKRILARLIQLIRGQSEDLSSTGKARGSGSSSSADKRLAVDAELNLTSTPASLALGLLFLRSDRCDMADVLAPPRCVAELDFVRPDVLFMHVLARHLILWNAVEPTASWLASVLPSWMRTQLERGEALSESAQLAHINMRSAACFVLGLRFAGSKDRRAAVCLWQQLDQVQREAGAKAVSFFSKIRQAATQAALDQVTLSLSLVLAGSGDVDLLRHLRRAHGDADAETSYGTHMATHMALGLLFLGGGRFTIGTSDLAIAALAIALMPPFPRSSSDNRAHLQAFRHLWILAVEPRMLIGTDVDTSEVASLPVTIESSSSSSSTNTWRKFTPLLLPAFEDVTRIQTASSRYWPTMLELASLTGGGAAARTGLTSSAQVLYVKRRPGHRSYAADPEGSRSSASRSAELAPLDLSDGAAAAIGVSDAELRELLDSSSNATKYGTLVEVGLDAESDSDSKEPIVQALLRTVTMDTLAEDQAYALPAFATFVLLRRLKADDSAGWLRSYADLKFVDDFYRHHFEGVSGNEADEQDKGRRNSHSRRPLVPHSLLRWLRARVHGRAEWLLEHDEAVGRVVCWYLCQRPGAACASLETQARKEGAELADVCVVLACSDLPALEEMRTLMAEIRCTASDMLSTGTPLAAVKSGLLTVARITVASQHQRQRQHQHGAAWTHTLLNRLIASICDDLVAAS